MLLANATAGKGQGLWQFSFRPYLNITTPAYNIKAGAYTEQYHLEPSRRTINLSTSNKEQRTDHQRITAIGLPSNNHSIVRRRTQMKKKMMASLLVGSAVVGASLARFRHRRLRRGIRQSQQHLKAARCQMAAAMYTVDQTRVAQTVTLIYCLFLEI